MPDRQTAGRLTADAWRRVCRVLDRMAHAQPESRERILEDACREHRLSIDEVRPFVDAQERSQSLPEELPSGLIADVFGDVAQAATDVRLNAGRMLGPYEIVRMGLNTWAAFYGSAARAAGPRPLARWRRSPSRRATRE